MARNTDDSLPPAALLYRLTVNLLKLLFLAGAIVVGFYTRSVALQPALTAFAFCIVFEWLLPARKQLAVPLGVMGAILLWVTSLCVADGKWGTALPGLILYGTGFVWLLARPTRLPVLIFGLINLADATLNIRRLAAETAGTDMHKLSAAYAYACLLIGLTLLNEFVRLQLAHRAAMKKKRVVVVDEGDSETDDDAGHDAPDVDPDPDSTEDNNSPRARSALRDHPRRGARPGIDPRDRK